MLVFKHVTVSRTACPVCHLSGSGVAGDETGMSDETNVSSALLFPLKPSVSNFLCSLLLPMALLFVKDQPRAAFFFLKYWHVTADSRQWYKPPPLPLLKNLRHAETLSLKWSQRGVETAPTLVFPQPQSLVVVKLSLPPLSYSLMCSSTSLISSPPLCFSYTPSQSHKGMRGRNEREESKQARGGKENKE